MGGEIINIPTDGGPPLGSEGQYPAQGEPPLTLDRTTVFNLIVNETVGEHSYKAQEQKIGSVEQPMPVINRFRARLDHSLYPTLILEWATDYADECEISGSPYQLKASSPEGGFKFPLSPVSPLLSTYTLTAINDTGTATSNITVEWKPSIPTPEGMPPNLYVLCVSPDAKLLYAGQTEGGAPTFGGPALCAFDVRTLQPSPPCEPVPFDNGFSFSPDGSRVYGAGATGTLHVLDGGTFKVIREVTVGGSVGGVAASPDGKLLYLADSQINAVRVIDASSFQPVGNPASVDHPPYGVAVSPDGSRVYATLLTSLDPSVGGSVVEFAPTGDLNNPLVFVAQVHVDYSPFGVAVSPDGERVFVVSGVRDWSNKVIPVFNFAVMVLDASLQPAGNPIPVGFSPFGVAVSPDGTGLFVTASGVLSAFAPTFTGGITG
jgi:WD40 repeat protein